MILSSCRAWVAHSWEVTWGSWIKRRLLRHLVIIRSVVRPKHRDQRWGKSLKRLTKHRFLQSYLALLVRFQQREPHVNLLLTAKNLHICFCIYIHSSEITMHVHANAVLVYTTPRLFRWSVMYFEILFLYLSSTCIYYSRRDFIITFILLLTVALWVNFFWVSQHIHVEYEYHDMSRLQSRYRHCSMNNNAKLTPLIFLYSNLWT